MIDSKNTPAAVAPELAVSEVEQPARRPYEAPQCEKKRSIHRVTLISGVGNMSVGALSVMGG